MTVLEFYNAYRNLSVPLVGGPTITGIDIHQYRNGKDYCSKIEDADDISPDHDVNVGMAAWNRLYAKIKKSGERAGKDKYLLKLESPTGFGMIRVALEMADAVRLMACFCGKGHPSHIAQALRLAVYFELLQPTHKAIYDYCQANIGMDCSGFVGNYLRHHGLGPNLGPSSKVSAFAQAPYRISELSAIRAGSVIVWASGSHVAIVHCILPQGPNGTTGAVVCESTGSCLEAGDADTDGMNSTNYVFESVGKDKVFKVRRGIGGRGLNSVYVANY